MHSGNAAAIPPARNEATLSFCHGSRSVRITTAILVSNCMILSAPLGLHGTQPLMVRRRVSADPNDASHRQENHVACVHPSRHAQGALLRTRSAYHPLASQAQARITHSLPPNS